MVLLGLFPISMGPRAVVFPSSSERVLIKTSSPSRMPLGGFSRTAIPMRLVFVIAGFLFPF